MSTAASRACLAAIIVGTLLGGCGSKKAAEKPTPARPERAFVRFDVLIASHPLQREVGRLGAAETRLRGLANVQKANFAGAGGNGDYVLPALAATTSERNAAVGAGATVSERRMAQRRRLGNIVARELSDYAGRLNTRLSRLVAQRRAELMAANAEQEAQNELKAREQAQSLVLTEIAAQLDRWIELVAGRAVLEAQLYPSSENIILPPVRNEDEFAIEVEKVRQNPDVKGVSLRARLEVERQNIQAAIDTIEARIRAIKAEGAKNIEGAASEIRAQRIAEIEARLDTLRNDTDVLFLLRQQRGELASALGREAAIAARVSATEAENGDGTAGTVALSDLSVTRQSGGAGLGIAQAADRIARQRRELQDLIREDVRDAVRDEAQERRIEVEFVEGAKTMAPQGRTDRTQDFGEWVRWDKRSASAGKAPAAELTEQGVRQ